MENAATKHSAKLIFVYNADSGLWNGAFDAMHKVFSPKTYACKLCKLTYGAFSVKKEWQAFINDLSIESRFLHRDEWEKEFALNVDLPAVFLNKEEELTTLVTADQMKSFDLLELKAYLEEYIKNIN